MKTTSFLLVACLCLCVCLQVSSADEGKEYVVQAGDTLSEICEKFMEHGTREIWEREAKRLDLSNPHLIYPGQIFYFPNVYRVAWTSKITGYSRHGDWFLNKELIISWVNHGNRDARIRHEIEVR